MQSIPVAMTWEMLRHGCWWLLASFLGANLFPALLLTALRFNGVLPKSDPSMILMHVLLVQCGMFAFGAGVFAAQGGTSRLYVYPATTSTLVAWRLLPAMVVVALELILSTAALNLWFDLDWPIWGPALFLATAVTAVQAALWLTERSAWMPLGVVVAGGLVGCWHKSRYGAIVGQPTHYWVQVTPVEVATMAAIVVLSFGLAVVAVARNRRGDPPLSIGVIDWLQRAFDWTPTSQVAFQTPAQAQFWFEWRKKGWAMPAAISFVMLVWFSIWLLSSRDPQDLRNGLLALGAILPAVGLIGGLILGNCGTSDATYEMGQFLGTRPMTTPEMAQTVLKVAARSVALAWAIWAVAFAALCVVLWATPLRTEPVLPEAMRWWIFPATLLGAWMVVALTASIALFGRESLFVQLLCGGVALFIGLLMFSQYALSVPQRLAFTRGTVTVLGVACLAGTAWAFMSAHQRALIGRPTVFGAFAFWTACSAAVVIDGMLHPADSVAPYVLIIGLLALSVAPLAAAPLALAANRNR
ncbi:MAG: hypothetical protein HY000_00315 [Planctomycetes bacterium]|nr:hypothetical protein [Planctomycetota bacterium]